MIVLTGSLERTSAMTFPGKASIVGLRDFMIFRPTNPRGLNPPLHKLKPGLNCIIRPNEIQAAGTMVQAVAAVFDNLFNPEGLMVSTVQASERLEATGSSMDTMMIELLGMKVTSKVKFQKYWFPNNKFVLWNEKIGTRSKEIDAAIQEGKELGDALVRRQIRRFARVETLIDIKNVGTLNKKLEYILELLTDESKTGLIKLQGDMGIGKRTILEHLNNNKSIVQQIQYLLLLDDVKVDIDVYTTGIPRNTNGSKLVITTNFKHLSFGHNPIGCVEIGRLKPAEAWKLFCNIAKPKKDLMIPASKIVKWCDCHFFLIRIVAENLKLEPYEEPSGSKIPRDCLFDRWAALGFLGDDMVENRNRIGSATLNCLIRKVILNECAYKQYVIMARVFRRVTTRILQEDKEFNRLFGKEAHVKLFNDIHWISLANREIENLPTKATCPKLTTLFSRKKNPKLLDIPNSFLNGMEELRVLDLQESNQ
ncbi:probable disease resistance protein [Tanacetum coccineum]|uniref:Probable disease resistance protein n=1 Tax=Tanacetum coccineum TaxID=301880 RepID=A0ABQ5CWD8_9ASTR